MKIRPIAKILALAAAAVLVGLSTPSFAEPGYAYSTLERYYSPGVCRDRAKAAFQSGGWTNVHTDGQPGLAVAADNGQLAGVMICLDRPVGDGSRGSIVVIFVMGGAGNTAYGARDLLEAYMKRWE